MPRTGAIVYQWGPSVRGREQQSIAAFGEALEYFEEQAKEGHIIGHKELFRTSRDGGMMIVEGLESELRALMQEDEFARLTVKAGAIVEDFTVELCLGGSDQTVQELMGMYAEVSQELGLY